MTNEILEQRVLALEKQLAELRAQVEQQAKRGDWRSLIGAFSGDTVMREIFEEGRKIREKERKKARAKTKRPARTKK